MTTRITIEPSSHPVMVEIADHTVTPEGLTANSYTQHIHLPGDPSVVLYTTTTRHISVEDLPETDPRVIKVRAACNKPHLIG